jgi:hypothetical protein
MRLALAMIVSASLAGCVSGSSGSGSGLQSRESGSCVIGGCGDEICADKPEISSCIWYADFVCYETASCGRRSDGTCGWIATPALTSCLAMHPR